jgi:hypothetical protein
MKAQFTVHGSRFRVCGFLAVVVSSLILNPSSLLLAATTIDTNGAYAYGANIGWCNAYADGTNGAVVGQFYCSGYIWSANVGWIALSDGNPPTNGWFYYNDSATDWGVNDVNGTGQLAGMAYGANIGWITFEQTYGMPTVNLVSGQLSGYAYSANCGWISLSSTVAVLQTDSLWPGLLDASGSGLPIAWEMEYFGTTNINPNADPTGKGFTVLQDYVAGTDPLVASDYLHITHVSATNTSNTATLTWTSHPSRLYYIEERTNMITGAWATNTTVGIVAPSPSPATTTTIGATDASGVTSRFYRVQAIVPNP